MKRVAVLGALPLVGMAGAQGKYIKTDGIYNAGQSEAFAVGGETFTLTGETGKGEMGMNITRFLKPSLNGVRVASKKVGVSNVVVACTPDGKTL